jgi:hypothetical protein
LALIRQQLLQTGVLLLQLPQPLNIVGVHAAGTLTPGANPLFADAVLPGDLGHRLAVGLAQDANHLLLGKSSLPHGSPLRLWGPLSPVSVDPKSAGQVRGARGIKPSRLKS